MNAPALDPALHGALRASLVLLFGVAAAHKLRDLRGFAALLDGYGLLPAPLLRPAALALGGAEVLLCAALVLPATARAAACAGAALLLLYAAAVAQALLRGRRAIDCGCGFAPRPLGRDLVLRNALLALAALAAALPVGQRALTGVDLWTIGCASAAAAALFAALDVAAAQRARWAA